MKGLSPRNLRYMRDFAVAYPQFTILQQVIDKSEINENQTSIILQRCVAKLPWGHNCTLLDKLSRTEERAFYARKAVKHGWTRDMLLNQIESGLFTRQGAITSNFEVTLPAYQSELAIQLFKDPYHLDFVMLIEEAKERDLENALINHITKMNLYFGLADDTLKGEYDDSSIGLILCKTKNKVVAEYALRDTNKPIGVAEYKIGAVLPENIKGKLPSIEEIEQKLDRELQEQLKPIDSRLEVIREKFKRIKNSK